MSKLFDLSNFDKYKEDNCLEVKKAEGGLPISLWESYSSFANSNGGVIILGIGERQDGTWYTTGLKNVESYEVNGDMVLVINVPRACFQQFTG